MSATEGAECRLARFLIDHRDSLPGMVKDDLLEILAEVAALRGQNLALVGRVAAQSALLSRRAESASLDAALANGGGCDSGGTAARAETLRGGQGRATQ